MAEMPDSTVRFQGQLEHREIGAYLDRTTLSPLDGGDVSQVIEISRDGGATWKATFDAVYRRVSADSAQGHSQPNTPAVSNP